MKTLELDLSRIKPKYLRSRQQGRSLNGRRSSCFPDLYIAGIAAEVGVVPSHITKLLSANRFYPSFPVARKLATVLGLTFSELIDMLDKLKLPSRRTSRTKVSRDNSQHNSRHNSRDKRAAPLSNAGKRRRAA